MTTDERIARVQYIAQSIEPGKITILTGSNGSGKSLVRKQLCFYLSDKLLGTDYKHLIAEVSMQRRTEANLNMGAMSSIMVDNSTEPTSCSTYYLIKILFDTFLNEEGPKRYLIIDEPEIGMSKESQIGFVLYLKEKIPDILKYTYGLLLITHSELIVDLLRQESVFINMDKDCTIDDWIHRKIIPTDFEELADESYDMFLAVYKYS